MIFQRYSGYGMQAPVTQQLLINRNLPFHQPVAQITGGTPMVQQTATPTQQTGATVTDTGALTSDPDATLVVNGYGPPPSFYQQPPVQPSGGVMGFLSDYWPWLAGGAVALGLITFVALKK
jgi:hypothetical protein